MFSKALLIHRRLISTLWVLLCLIHSVQAQESVQRKSPSLSLGLTSQSLLQPGLRIGCEWKLNTWEVEDKIKSVFLRPEIAGYFRTDVHISYLMQVNGGYVRTKADKGSFSAWSLGLGYLHQSQVTEYRVALSDGSKEKMRQNWPWFLATINYEFGKNIGSDWSWYGRISPGTKISAERESAALLFIEWGVIRHL